MDVLSGGTGLVGLKTHTEKNEVGQDVFLFHHCPFCNYLTSLINSVSTVINEDIKLPLEEIFRLTINRESRIQNGRQLNQCQRIRNEEK